MTTIMTITTKDIEADILVKKRTENKKFQIIFFFF